MKKVDCKSCIFFLNRVINNTIEKTPDLSLCSKIGFRIFDKKDPLIDCAFYTPQPPTPNTLKQIDRNIKVMRNKNFN